MEICFKNLGTEKKNTREEDTVPVKIQRNLESGL